MTIGFHAGLSHAEWREPKPPVELASAIGDVSRAYVAAVRKSRGREEPAKLLAMLEQLTKTLAVASTGVCILRTEGNDAKSNHRND